MTNRAASKNLIYVLSCRNFHPSFHRSLFFFLLSIREKEKKVFKRNPWAIRITRYSLLTWNSLLPHDLAFLIYFSVSLQLSHTKRYYTSITISILNHRPEAPNFSFFFPSPEITRKNNLDRLSPGKRKRNMSSKMAFTLTIPRFHSPISRKPTTICSSPPSRTQSAHFSHGRSISLRRRLFLLPVKATTDQSGVYCLFCMWTIFSFN